MKVRLILAGAVLSLAVAVPAVAEEQHQHEHQSTQGSHQNNNQSSGQHNNQSSGQHNNTQIIHNNNMMMMGGSNSNNNNNNNNNNNHHHDNTMMMGAHDNMMVGGQHGNNRNFDRRSYQRNFTATRRFHYHGGGYIRPAGWYYRRWVFGEILPAIFWSQSYWIGDYYDYDLPPPPPGYVWVRYGDDALLVSQYNGEVLQVEYGLFD